MSNLIDIQSQIEKLQKQANEIKTKDFNATVHEILSKMAAFGITVKDLQSSKTGKGKAGRVAKGKLAVKKLPKVTLKVSNPVAPKYRGPNGEIWTGRGLTPKWLSQLISQGQVKETFLIAS